MSTDRFDPYGERSSAFRYEPHQTWNRRFSRLIDSKIAVDLYFAAEMLSIFLAGLIIAELYVRGILGVESYVRQYMIPLLLVPVLSTILQRNRQLMDLTSLCRFSASIGKVLLCVLLAFVIVIVIGFVAGIANDYSRFWYASWFSTSIVMMLASRAIASRIFSHMARSGLIQKTVAIYGDGRLARDVAGEIDASDVGIRIAGIFGSNGKKTHGLEALYRGNLDDLISFGQRNSLDTIIVAIQPKSQKAIEDLMERISVLPAEVQLHMGFGSGRIPIRGVSSLNELRLLDIHRKPISDWGLMVKTIEDYLIAALSAVLFLPLFALVAIAIKIDSKGPVIFRQRRHGFNHEVINVLKFRTMTVMEDGDDFKQAVQGDSRVTRVGRILRRTSIDELPQIFNVLKGDMSIVGPRPHPLALNSQYAGLLARYETRHRVKPGITGWAQINGFRGPTDEPELMKKRVEYDLEYIENWSLWMDLKILAATPFLGIVHKQAF